MIHYQLYKLLPSVMIILAVIVFTSCEKKSEQKQADIKTESVSPDTISVDGEPGVSDPVVEEKITIPDLKGTWTGTFDGKSTTLSITEQLDSSFTGKISINYKQPLSQDVKGNFSPATLKITMADQLHSKFMGKYDGIFSKDFNNFSGMFTKNRDGSQFSFNLKKK